MKIKKYKILLIIVLTIFSLILMQNNSFATGFSASASSTNLTPGNTATLSISTSKCAGQFSINSSNSNVISVGSNSEWVDGNTNVTLTAKSAGTATITVTATDVADDQVPEPQPITGSKTVTITVTDPTPVVQDPEVVDTKPAPKPTTTSKPATTTKKEEVKKSSDANLKELIVAEGAISPEFSADVKEYAISVPNEITALNITATQNDSKATVKIEGNSDLKVGENKIAITVIAEDGITNVYTLNVTRQKLNISLATLKITYIDEEGNTKELVLNPTFDPSILAYNIDEAISYLINSLKVEAISSIEGATVEITGNENLVEGQNLITITITMKAEVAAEGEEQLPDEVVIYTINFTKQAEPTFWQKVKNWFGGIAGTISTFYNDHQNQMTFGAIAFCVVALLGLSIYIVIDYNKYKVIIQKLKKVGEINNTEFETEMVGNIETAEMPENISNNENIQEIENKEEVSEEKTKEKSGKHF